MDKRILNLRKNLKKYREEHKISLKEVGVILGEKSKYYRTVIYGWENGIRTPNLQSLLRLCDKTNTTIEYWLRD